MSEWLEHRTAVIRQQEMERQAEEERQLELKLKGTKEPVVIPIAWGKGQVDFLLERLDQQEEVLVQAGFPRLSRWWRTEIERFLRSGRRRWVIRVGRRGGKSTSLMRLLVAFVRSGLWHVSPGTIAVIPIMSVDKEEAGDRLNVIEAILKALGMTEGRKQKGDYKRTNAADGGKITIHDLTMEFRVYAVKLTAVGFTSIACFGDEVAKWDSAETHANPAEPVMKSIRPSMASQPLAFEILASAPWGTNDYHAKLFDEGDTDEQIVSYAPTWVANDNWITEEKTHEYERDPKEWARAYKAIPGVTISTAFERDQVLAAFRYDLKGEPNHYGFVALDPSELREDAFAGIAGTKTSEAELVVQQVFGWEADEITPDFGYRQIAQSVNAIADQYHTGEIWGDQCEQASLTDHFNGLSKYYHVYNWSNASKHEAVVLLRRLMRERKLVIGQEHEKLRQQLIECKAEKMPSGITVYHTNGLDYLSALMTLAHAVNDGRYKLEAPSGLSKEDWEEFNQTGTMPAADGL